MAGAAFGRLHEAPPFAPFSNMSYMMQRLSVTVLTAAQSKVRSSRVAAVFIGDTGHIWFIICHDFFFKPT